MSTVNELFRKTQAIIDDTLDNINMVDWFNQCQDNLLDILYFPTKITITKNVSGKFIIPDNCNGELKILEPSDISVYSIYDNELCFTGYADVLTIDITYNKTPAIIINNPDQIPDIKYQFHSAYVFFAAMMAMSADEETERYSVYEKEFMRIKGQIQKFYGKMRIKPSNWTVIR